MPTPPRARRADPVESVHGVPVPDPWRWLEDGDAADVQAWTAAQDAAAREALGALPGRAALHARLRALAAIGRIEGPALAGGRLFHHVRAGTQDHAVLVVRDTLDAPARPLLDPNGWAGDGTRALDWWIPSADGRLVAYGVSTGGTEQSTLRVRDVATGADGPEAIPRTRAGSVAFLPDGSGFYYTRYPAPGTVPAGEEAYHRRVYFHARGTAPDGRDDACVCGAAFPKERWPVVETSDDGRHVLVTGYEGWTRSSVHLLDRTRPEAGFRTLVDGPDAIHDAQMVGDRLVIRTNDGAPRYRVLVADLARPDRDAWRELVPEGEATLEGVQPAGGWLVLREQVRAQSRLRVVDAAGATLGTIALPAAGTVAGVAGEPDRPDVVFDCTGFFHAPGLHHARLPDLASRPLAVPTGGVDPARFVVTQETVRSRDGTPVTMFLCRRGDVTPDGARPTVLTGYGGFSISLTPQFSAAWVSWVEGGGVLAVPNLRGGGEYGEAWHQDGMLARKQNVFDDFAAAADWLVESGWTRRERLGIAGGSNGGLLVLATITQRPDLCRAAVASVPLADMVRYHRFQLARLWIPEYGCADDPEQFRTLLAYSPYHHVAAGAKYPAVLLTTGASDTRVDPLHARKMAAALQDATGSGRPVWLRVEGKAGHGQGMPLRLAIEQQADVWSFLAAELGT